jgi:phosphoribosyl 1,2-cyclic phosphate phosphodiesterase
MDQPLKITFLGTGTSQGVPVIACNCPVCNSKNPKDKRLRASVMVETDGKTIIIDTGPDFRQQMLRENVKDINAIIFTHEHKDHVAGLDDVRAYNFVLKKRIDVFAEIRVQKALEREFAYIFAEYKYPGIPEINMHLIDDATFEVEGIKIIPIRVYHYELPVFGFRIGNFAYLTDVKTIADKEKFKLDNLDVLVINALRKEEHISHFNLKEALALIEELHPKQAFLTHLSHRFGLHEAEEPSLPVNVKIAYDGLTIIVN